MLEFVNEAGGENHPRSVKKNNRPENFTQLRLFLLGEGDAIGVLDWTFAARNPSDGLCVFLFCVFREGKFREGNCHSGNDQHSIRG